MSIWRQGRIVNDSLYGIFRLPKIIDELWDTYEAQRARNVNTSILPNELLPYEQESRWHHGIGVLFLTLIPLLRHAHIPEIREHMLLLLAAAAYHDVGNPPFTHLGEEFLKKAYGKDGETQLGDILTGSQSERILRNWGISVDEMVDVVTGQTKLSEIIHGPSVDLDNLDGVARCSRAARLGGPRPDVRAIARALLWRKDG